MAKYPEASITPLVQLHHLGAVHIKDDFGPMCFKEILNWKCKTNLSLWRGKEGWWGKKKSSQVKSIKTKGEGKIDEKENNQIEQAQKDSES